ncbi:MAG: hypothetical protein AAF282_19660 [Cyanobacteria bacterium P01_A01_bin.15]
MESSNKKNLIWFVISLLASFFIGLEAVENVFRYDFLIQDDARQHVVWLEQYLDPELFDGNLIASYFQSVLPDGYRYLYRLLAALGISPIGVSKVIPVFLYTAIAVFTYRLTTTFLRSPLAGFFSTSILTYTLLFTTVVSSATPRAFLNLFFLSFLYYWVHRSTVGTWISLVFLGLYYPQTMLVAAGTGILSLIRLDTWRVRVSANRDLIYRVLGVITITLAFAGYFLLLKPSDYGPIVTRAQAVTDAAYLKGGRSSFFSESFLGFWLFGGRSGLLPGGFSFFQPRLLLVCTALPVLWAFPQYFPLVKQIDRRVFILARLVAASIALYALAHLLLFKLHLPSRYTQHSIRVVMAILSGITLCVIFDALRIWLTRQRVHFARKIAPFVLSIAALLVLIYPVYLSQVKDNFPKTGYIVGHYPKIYQFFQAQPKDSLIASLEKEAANIPAFSLRSVLVAPEYGVAYHRGYYQQFRQRVKDLIEATFSENNQVLVRFVEKYEIDFFMVNENTFSAGFFVENNDWPQEYDVFIEPLKRRRGLEDRSALSATIETCTVVQSKGMLLLDAGCIVEDSSSSPQS